jgi:hydroxymethylpyrimidine pyrophosphatase-like HAD family hydrolase
LGDAIFQHHLSDDEAAQLVSRYVQESGDAAVHDRLFLNKLLVGLWAQDLASLGLQNSRLLPRRREFHSKYVDAWNFLLQQTLKECGKLLCHKPESASWHAPLVVADVDGVLDRMVFGFPCTTAAGIRAISLLHAHGFAVALNTARTLGEVKQYCVAYGFAGGVAEYGSVAWDRITDREIILVTPESRNELEQMRQALEKIPGVFLNDDYRYSLRAFTYQGDRTVPLPTMLAKDLAAKLGCSHLRIHQTGLDTAIIAKEADKGSGLTAMLQMAGIAPSQVTTIGDTDPDLDMFRVSAASFAPGHIPCRREALLLGCHIARAPYQVGLLESVRRLAHPAGDRCDKCNAVESNWARQNKTLFTGLLAAADEKPLSLSMRNLFTCSPFEVLRK